MKKTTYLFLLILVIISCKKETNFVTLSGKVTNKNTDSLLIFHPETNFSKIIKLNQDGIFKDTLKVNNGLFTITNGKDFSLLYLINGDNISMNLDANTFNKSLKFTGDHEIENNFLATSVVNESALFSDPTLFYLPKKEFDAKINTYVAEFNNRLNQKKLTSDFLNHQKEEIKTVKEYIIKEYNEKNFAKIYLKKGNSSPKFNNYENFKGGTTSLEDLKGKYVYIDVWATWCKPCKDEIPYLKKVEKDFHKKNIEFVSISIDDARAYETWKHMVSDKELGGIQLYAKGDNSFATAYKINSIPRFILIDSEGNIVDANAPRPSDPQLIKLLNSLSI